MKGSRRLTPAATAVFLLVTLMVAVPSSPAAAEGPADPAISTGVEISEPEQVIDIPLPSAEDRFTTDTPNHLNSEANPDEVALAWGDATDPQTLIDQQLLQPAEGDGSVDVYAESKISGDHYAVVYPDVVNEENRRGLWRDISLEPAPTPYGWRMDGDTFSTDLPAAIDPATPLVFHMPQGDIATTPVGVSTSPGYADGNAIAYDQALPGTDFTYTPAPGGYKEYVTLWTPAAGLQVSWDLTTAFTLTPAADGTIDVSDATGMIATIGTPVVYDSAEPASQTVATYTVTSTGPGTYRMTATISEAWASTALYPLTLDPGQTNNIAPSDDAYVDSSTTKKKAINYGSAATLEGTLRTRQRRRAWFGSDRVCNRGG